MGAELHKRARYLVNLEVKTGRMPRPNDLPCADCGHVWSKGERRHEYDHYRGYDPVNALDVVAVCTTCHARRTAGSPTCGRGHPWTMLTTIHRADGRRTCRACRRVRENGRRDAAWWRARRAKKRAA